MAIKPGTYKNIVEFADKNGLLDEWNEEVGPDRTFEEYLDEYSDRPIVKGWMEDYSCTTLESVKWSCGNGHDWKRVKIKIEA